MAAMFELIRVEIGDAGAFGVLKFNSRCFAVTVEHTYSPDNHVKIPEGDYLCHRTMFNRGGYQTYQIPVAGHSEIKFHVANTEADVDGCVGVAKSFGIFGSTPGIQASRLGFAEFMSLANDAPTIALRVRQVK